MVSERPSETSPLLSNDRYNDLTKHVSSEDIQEVPGKQEIQYPGLPEVRKKLKYILPAITIGVRKQPLIDVSQLAIDYTQVFLSAADQTLVAASYGNIGSDLNALNNASWIATS